MGYWMIWICCLFGIFLGVGAYRYIVNVRKWSTVLGMLLAAVIVCAGSFGSYYLIYGSFPNLSGLYRIIEGVWNEAVYTVKTLWKQILSAFGK